MLETRALMSSEKDKLTDTANREKSLIRQENDRVRQELETQIAELKKQNEILEDNYRKSQIREQELRNDVQGLTNSVERRGELEEKVVNIGLSNNYFKNVAEIFKRQITAWPWYSQDLSKYIIVGNGLWGYKFETKCTNDQRRSASMKSLLRLYS